MRMIVKFFHATVNRKNDYFSLHPQAPKIAASFAWIFPRCESLAAPPRTRSTLRSFHTGFFYETKKFACFLFAFLYRCYFSFCTLRQADQVAGSSSSTSFHFKNYETASARLITKLSLVSSTGTRPTPSPSSPKPALMLLFHPKTSANKR